MQDILTIMEDMCSQMHNVGNNRITVSLADGHIEEVNHYYPFGGLMGDSRNATTQPYKYIGKELDRTHGLDWYDHGARHYDPVTGRWNTMDPMCEKYYGISPYASCGDDPVKYVDNDGKIIRVPKSTQRKQFLGYINSIAQGVWGVRKNGELYMKKNTNTKGYSESFKKYLLNTAKSRSVVSLYISKENPSKEKGKNEDIDKVHKGGVTTREDFLVNNKEVISEFNIYITGNSNETLIGKNGKKIEDGPELILGHEFFAHVFPVLFGSITGNGIKNENILRRELGKEERKEDEHPE